MEFRSRTLEQYCFSVSVVLLNSSLLCCFTLLSALPELSLITLSSCPYLVPFVPLRSLMLPDSRGLLLYLSLLHYFSLI